METAEMGIDAPGLIAAAAAEGFTVSPRSLELWRYRGLLPRPRRAMGTKGAWLYARQTEAQLLRLLRWREQTRRLDVILIGLWVDGFDIRSDDALAAMVRIVDSFSREMLGELGGAEDKSAALERLAHKLASKRGRGGLPRVVRMPASERTRAVAFMLAHLLDLEEEIANRAGDRVLLERMFGLRSGHAGGFAAMLGTDQDPMRIPRLPSRAKLQEMLRAASEEEVELVRRVAHVLVVWIPLLLPSLVDEYGAKAARFQDFMSALGTDPGPDLHAFAAITILMSVHIQAPSIDELRSQLRTFTPAAVNLELLDGIAVERRGEAFTGLPQRDQDELADALRVRRASRGDAS